LPDFEFNNWLITQQKQYLKELINMGVTGFRIDAAKHLPLNHLNAVIEVHPTKAYFVS